VPLVGIYTFVPNNVENLEKDIMDIGDRFWIKEFPSVPGLLLLHPDKAL